MNRAGKRLLHSMFALYGLPQFSVVIELKKHCRHVMDIIMKMCIFGYVNTAELKLVLI